MTERIINKQHILAFSEYLKGEEKSKNTIEKYLRDVDTFLSFAGGDEITKEKVVAYKNKLLADNYSCRSVNSMISSINSYLSFVGLSNLKLKSVKIQRDIYCSEEKELTKSEYTRLINAAKQAGNERLYLVIQTICATGIRVGELRYITVEAVRRGEAVVSLKGKTRTVFIADALRKKLLGYIKGQNIATGAVFVTRTGKPLNRTNIWREMKTLCVQANVSPDKVFPHNLRHLFARTFYEADKDIAKLADVLGHSSINTTRIYIIGTGREHRRLIESLHLLL